MTLHAGRVLEDCRASLEDLRNAQQGSEWRRRWVATITLLRAVGHILMKIDAAEDKRIKAAVDTEWNNLNASKPEPQIFWNFIERERNNILKEYKLSTGGAIVAIVGGEQSSVSLFYRMHGGPFSGRDPRELVAEAIEWWEKYLNSIEC